MEQTVEAPGQETTVQEPVKESNDPFSIDESALSSLAPEARIAFDNATKQWRSKAEEYAKSYSQKQIEEATSKYKDYDEKSKMATALQQLTADPRFVQWYQYIQSQQQHQQQTHEQPVATPEEFAIAVQEAASGNNQKLDAIIARKFQVMAAPFIKQFQDQQVQTQQDREIDKLFKSHPDAEELDQLGRSSDNEPSLLEWAIYDIVDKKGGTYEQAYQHARRIADQLTEKSKKAALGLVNEKKQSVTEKAPQQSKETENVIEVSTAEEALRKNAEAAMRGQKVTYVAKSRLSRK